MDNNPNPIKTSRPRVTPTENDFRERERISLLKSAEADFVIPQQFILKASKMRGMQGHIEKLLNPSGL